MKVYVGINGFGTIGKRVAEAVMRQKDMELVGIVKVTPDYSALLAIKNGIRVYTLDEKVGVFKQAGIDIAGTIKDLLSDVDIIVDATPAGYGVKYKKLYNKFKVKAVFQGGEKPDVAEVSFNSLCNYEEALNKSLARVVSCNTTGLLRVICSLNYNIGVKNVRATIIRRGADPKEVKKGPINSITLNPVTIPSHHSEDVKTILPWLDIITSAVIVPTTLMHVHVVTIKLQEYVTKDTIISILKRTPRTLLINSKRMKISSTAELVELARDLGRKRYDMPELIIWEDSILVNGDEVFLVQAVHQESIVIPENIDAIRALTGLTIDKWESIKLTDTSLGIMKGEILD